MCQMTACMLVTMLWYAIRVMQVFVVHLLSFGSDVAALQTVSFSFTSNNSIMLQVTSKILLLTLPHPLSRRACTLESVFGCGMQLGRLTVWNSVMYLHCLLIHTLCKYVHNKHYFSSMPLFLRCAGKLPWSLSNNFFPKKFRFPQVHYFKYYNYSQHTKCFRCTMT